MAMRPVLSKKIRQHKIRAAVFKSRVEQKQIIIVHLDDRIHMGQIDLDADTFDDFSEIDLPVDHEKRQFFFIRVLDVFIGYLVYEALRFDADPGCLGGEIFQSFQASGEVVFKSVPCR